MFSDSLNNALYRHSLQGQALSQQQGYYDSLARQQRLATYGSGLAGYTLGAQPAYKILATWKEELQAEIDSWLKDSL